MNKRTTAALAAAADTAREHLWQRRDALIAELDALSAELGLESGDLVPCPECHQMLHRQGLGPHRTKHKRAGA